MHQMLFSTCMAIACGPSSREDLMDYAGIGESQSGIGTKSSCW